MKTVRIRNRDMAWDIAADIRFPPSFNENGKYPAIISVHPIGSCKDQTSGNIYGAALAKEGFVVIAFDASFQGASGGEPRFIEDPTHRVNDIRKVADYLVTLPYVDEDRIGVIGVCGGGAYSINAAMTERRIKAVASVTGVNFGRLMREGFSGYDPQGALEAIARQRTAEARGGELRVDNFLPPSPEEAERRGQTERDLYEATEYYRTPRGEKPHGATSMLFSHAGPALGWDAFHLAEVLLTQPLMVVTGDKVGAFGRTATAWRSTAGAIGEEAARRARRLVPLRPLRQARTGRQGAREARSVLQGAPGSGGCRGSEPERDCRSRIDNPARVRVSDPGTYRGYAKRLGQSGKDTL